MNEDDGGRTGRSGTEESLTGALTVGPWQEQVPVPRTALEPAAEARGSTVAPQPAGGRRRDACPESAVDPGPGRSPRHAPAPAPAPSPAPSPSPGPEPDPGPKASARAAVYREVRDGEAFQEVRGRYRRFAFRASAAFFVWYLAYVVAATTAPGLMARPLVGPVNVAMAAGLAQFVTTFGLTWAYARHARRHRDRSALDVRWDTQDRTR